METEAWDEEQRDHFGFLAWLMGSDRWGDQEDLATWRAMTDEEQAHWVQEARRIIAAHESFDPSTRRALNEMSMAEILRSNDRRLRELTREDGDG